MIEPSPGIAGLLTTLRSGRIKPSSLEALKAVRLWSMLPPTVK